MAESVRLSVMVMMGFQPPHEEILELHTAGN